MNNIHSNNNKRLQLSLVRFLFLFTFHQLVDAWRKFANSASKVIMLRYNRNSSKGVRKGGWGYPPLELDVLQELYYLGKGD